jgi:hypothetical protein
MDAVRQGMMRVGIVCLERVVQGMVQVELSSCLLRLNLTRMMVLAKTSV